LAAKYVQKIRNGRHRRVEVKRTAGLNAAELARRKFLSGGEEDTIPEFALNKNAKEDLESGKRAGKVAASGKGVSASRSPGLVADPVLSAIQKVQESSPQSEFRWTESSISSSGFLKKYP
jgi:hypothetical protein